MDVIISGGLGTVFFTVVVFIAGALIGAPLWNWMKTKMPWSN